MSDPLDSELDRQLEAAEDVIEQTRHQGEGTARSTGDENAGQLKAENLALHASLEDTVVKYSLLTEEYETLRKAFQEAELRYQASLLDKELQLTNVEADLTTLQLNHKELLATAQEADALRESVKTLTDWHADLVAKLAVCEQELQIKSRIAEGTNESIGEMQRRLEELKALCELLESSSAVSDQLVEIFTAVEDRMSKENKKLKQEIQELRTALNDGVASLILERDQLAQQYASTSAAKERLEKKLREVEPQLIPLWEQLNQERKESKRPSEASHRLVLSLLEARRIAALSVQRVLLNAQSSLTNDGRLPLIISPMLDRFIISLGQFRTFLVQTAVLMRHMINGYVREWVKVAEVNVANLNKDKPAINWTYQAIKDMSDLVYWICEMCQFFRRSGIPCDQMFEMDLAVEGSPGKGSVQSHLEAAASCIDVLLTAFMTDNMSTALSTQPVAVFSKRLASFLKSKNYNEELMSEKWVPVTLTNRYAGRMLSAVVVCLANLDKSPDTDSKLMQTVQIMLKDFENLDQDVFAMDIVNQNIEFSIKTELSSDTESHFASPLALLITLCAALEAAGDITDPSETWSPTHFLSVKEAMTSYGSVSRFDEDFVNQLCRSYQTWSSSHKSCQASTTQLMAVEMTRWVMKQIESGDVKRSETKRASMTGPQSPTFDLTDSTSPTIPTVQEDADTIKKMKERIALMEVELERLRREEREFKESEEKQKKIILELNDVNKQRIIAESNVQTLRTQVKDLTRKSYLQDENIRQLMAVRKVQDMAPPSVASFELLKTKASMYKLQNLVTDMAMYTAERDWEMAMRLLNLSSPIDRDFKLHEHEQYRSMMKLRESLIETSAQNIGLDALKSLLTGQKVNTQEMFRKHQHQRRQLLALKSRLETLTSSAVIKG